MARVLLIEDEAAILMFLAEVLEDAGHEVVQAITREEAETALASLEGRLDVLVTDVNVGVRGWGFAFARQVRETHPAVGVLYISGDSEARVTQEGVAGARALPKPFTSAELLRAVGEAWGRV